MSSTTQIFLPLKPIMPPWLARYLDLIVDTIGAVIDAFLSTAIIHPFASLVIIILMIFSAVIAYRHISEIKKLSTIRICVFALAFTVILLKCSLAVFGTYAKELPRALNDKKAIRVQNNYAAKELKDVYNNDNGERYGVPMYLQDVILDTVNAATETFIKTIFSNAAIFIIIVFLSVFLFVKYDRFEEYSSEHILPNRQKNIYKVFINNNHGAPFFRILYITAAILLLFFALIFFMIYYNGLSLELCKKKLTRANIDYTAKTAEDAYRNVQIENHDTREALK